MLQIDANIPIPKRSHHRVSQIANTIKQMNIGESVKLPAEANGSSWYNNTKKLGVEVTVRKMDNGDHRVWRIN